MTVAEQPHIPVMMGEVLEALAPVAGEVYVDGTFGAGGYTCHMLDAADCSVLAIDRDANAVVRADEVAGQYGKRFKFLRGPFSEAYDLVTGAGFDLVDGFVLDLGVSSMQLDEAKRGFSFRFDGPLDMRMDQTEDTATAADIVNYSEENFLIKIIGDYGQERFARRVARRIIERRQEEKITRTAQLADIVRSAVPKSKKDNIDPATRTFQALRILVNDELGELKRALVAAERLLRPGGRLVIVSFHSLEDGIVKEFLFERAGKKGRGSRHLPDLPETTPQTFALKSGKAVFPSDEETQTNPRARSARLRVAVRTDVAAEGGES